jgi:hypothetical protein
MPDLYAFASQVEQFGGRITSTYRSQEEQNALIAQGKTTTRSSQHTDGTGIDVVFPNANAKVLAIQNAKARGINALDEGNHVHFGIPREVYRGGPAPYTSPTPGAIKADETLGSEGAKYAVDQQRAGFDVDQAAAKARAEVEAKAAGERGANTAKRAQDAGRFNMVAQEAMNLLDKATGSGVGAAYDSAAAWFGKSTEGAQANARLETIGGQLIMFIPRMEGPQSDRDAAIYRQAAADVANASKPVATRKAALETAMAIQAKYANMQSAPASAPAAAPAGNGWGIRLKGQ